MIRRKGKLAKKATSHHCTKLFPHHPSRAGAHENKKIHLIKLKIVNQNANGIIPKTTINCRHRPTHQGPHANRLARTLSLAFFLAPASSSSRAQSTSPRIAANISGVHPTCVCANVPPPQKESHAHGTIRRHARIHSKATNTQDK